MESKLFVSGGFQFSDKVASNVSCDLSHLSANHEEADTRIVLHAADATRRGYERMIVCCRDTDVLLLLCVFSNYLSKEVWMKAGTKKRPQMIGIHDIRLDEDIRQGLLAFHAVTGCDTTSQFAGITKKSAWKVFEKEPHLLHTLGRDQTPGPDVFAAVEAFVCKLYDPSTTSTSIQHVRCSHFRQCKTNIDFLPPTEDALVQHMQRAHYQTLVWQQSMERLQTFPDALSCGWYELENTWKPLLLTKQPIEKGQLEVKTCRCKEIGLKCSTRSCTCVNNKFCCTDACGCSRNSWCQNPYN